MFTGLVKELGTISKIQENEEGRLFTISSTELLREIEVDDSVSVNGACQTVVKKDVNSFSVQAVQVTLDKTNFGQMKVGQDVNLELAMRLSDRLGGHLVQGHINETGILKNISKNGDNYLLEIKVSEKLNPYILDEGSIAIDGISLTVAKFDLAKKTVHVSIIPHTWENTNLSSRRMGDKLNIEVDIIAKYLENILLRKNTSPEISKEWLSLKGFA